MGSDTLGYSYAREFYKHYGVKSLLLSSVNARYVSLSKFLDCEIVPGIDKEDVLVDWLRKNAPRFKDAAPIVFSGTGDWRIRTLSKHKEELTALGYYIPAIDFPLLDKISQKDIFYSYCAKLGVPFPKTRAWCFNGYKLEEELAKAQKAAEDRSKDPMVRDTVTEEEISEVVARWTGSPVSKLM